MEPLNVGNDGESSSFAGGGKNQGANLPMVNVVAPATLEEGYTFEAQVGDRTFMATVPQGGVKEGETFVCPLPAQNQGPSINAPKGQWKDGLFDFLNYGFCHPHFCCSFWFTQVAMGQVMQRMNLTWLGTPGPEEQTRNTFKVALVLVISYNVYEMTLDYLAPDNVWEGTADMPISIKLLKILGDFLMISWSIYALKKTRQYVRLRYGIPEERFVGYEDLCYSAFCCCCTVAQISRHTGEYETYAASCFTETGLHPSAPHVV